MISHVDNNGAYAPVHDVYAGVIVPSRFDVFCLGSTLHEILIGDVPHSNIYRLSAADQQLVQQLGSLKADLLVGMLQKD